MGEIDSTKQTDFKEFRLESDWPRYKDKFETSMDASRMGHTIKKGHKITNPEVDRAQMDWTYALLQEKMQQSTAKAIVLRHKNTKDTRVIYAEIDATLSSSTAYKLQLSKLTNYLCTARIVSGNWRGTQQTFILHY